MLEPARALLAALLVTACSSDSASSADGRAAGARHPDAGGSATVPASGGWQAVFSDLPGGLFSVWGENDHDVWSCGSDAHDGHGPLVLHYDGAKWLRRFAARSGDFWWMHGFPSGTVFFGGSNGTIVRFESGRFSSVAAPRTIGTVFGVWGSDEHDVWAVGGDVLYGTGAFVWHFTGDRFEDVGTLPIPPSEVIAYFKVWGTSKSDVWVVGTPGLSMHFDGTSFSRADPSVVDPLFTVHARAAGDLYAAVGGADLGVLIERGPGAAWSPATLPEGTRTLFGVWLTPNGGYAVGDDGTVLTRGSGAWANERTALAFQKALHSVWVDPTGDVWAVGGDILAPPYGAGALIHKGKRLPSTFSIDTTQTSADASSDGAGTSDATPPPADGSGKPEDAAPPAHDAQHVDAGARDARPEASTPLDAHAEGGAPPKVVACGTGHCTLPNETCCADENTGVGAGCVAAGTPCPTGQAPVFCDEPSDCASGFACCLNRLAQVGPLQNVDCEPSCYGPSVCASDADCGGQACKTFTIMPSYRTCPPPSP